MNALIFGCDGVLVDYEIEWTRVALNQVWQENGIDWELSVADCREELGIPGDHGYLLALRHNPLFRAAFQIPVDDAKWLELVTDWHRRKTELCMDMARARGSSVRTGIRRLAREGLAAGWRVVVASVLPRSSMDLVTAYAFGAELMADIAVVSGAEVPATRPTPQLFTLAAAAAEADPTDCVVVENTRDGLLAATAIDMSCVITPTPATFHADFSEAQLVVTGLGEPDGPPEVIIGGRVLTTARPWCGVADLAELLTVAQGTRRRRVMT